jgi:protein-S-isoprenylcysteine O-methyltransferase Ste14
LVVITAIITLGFWAPWIETSWFQSLWIGAGRRITLLEGLALEISRLGLVSFAAATPLVIALGSLVAAKGVWLRVWGTAYLGAGTVNHGQMKGGAVVADGPYRYVRNPLYLGTWGTVAAMAFVMPPSGALVTMALLSVFLLRLILGEEAFLSAKLGEPYRLYLQAVPRLIPRVRTNLPRGDGQARWASAVLAELLPIGVLFTLSCLSWRYDHWLMIRAILISFGVSLVVRAAMPRDKRLETRD